MRPDANVLAFPCSLFVALAEEGWLEGELVEQIARKYLSPLFETPMPESVDTLVLGCTHFPALRQAIQAVVGDGIRLIDSAETTAKAVDSVLLEEGLKNNKTRKGEVELLVTDGPERFARVAPFFLGRPVSVSQVELVDLSCV